MVSRRTLRTWPRSRRPSRPIGRASPSSIATRAWPGHRTTGVHRYCRVIDRARRPRSTSSIRTWRMRNSSRTWSRPRGAGCTSATSARRTSPLRTIATSRDGSGCARPGAGPLPGRPLRPCQGYPCRWRARWSGSINLTANSLDFNRELRHPGGLPGGGGAAGPAFPDRLGRRGRGSGHAGPTPTTGYVDHAQATLYINQEATVELSVKAIYQNSRVIWLMPNEKTGHQLQGGDLPQRVDKWPDRPDRFYVGKTIRVTGLVEQYRGAPGDIVEEPSQIKIQ